MIGHGWPPYAFAIMGCEEAILRRVLEKSAHDFENSLMITYVGYGDRDLDRQPVPYVRRYPELLVMLAGQCALRKAEHRENMHPSSALADASWFLSCLAG